MSSNFKNLYTSNNPPLIATLIRGSNIESIHKIHAVISDKKGRVLMCAGNPEYKSFIRSALKPFQAIPFVSSGAASKINNFSKSIAIACASHSGSKLHAREAFKILWEYDIDIKNLKCPKLNTSPLEHNCSGKHAAFLATCKKLNWPIDNYLKGDHPLQLEIFRIVSELLEIPISEINAERDDCGAPTLYLKLIEMSRLYSLLSSSEIAELEQISRAITTNPLLISDKNKFDTEIIKASHGQVIGKGGAEGIQCLCKVNEGIGLALKVEDGSKRAKHAVSLHLLKQLEWISDLRIQDIEEKIFNLSDGVRIEVKGQLKFQES
ncbi:asparaginase [Prochlorococcus marinus XMU1411]|uniref:asparaginase n=1 Tax=Prochlorococcus marinus TaxID=1219 RepID=UPI001ADB6D05|nr:asparaginase [Prochlorococcus marinus]MBO8243867.1 asparaginase [Prochlorococcus marinus XMU1411]MBW3054965.1 asparaginase [Prochlorococcus marinus str. MU1411]MCR8538559.1 asparaginase [Prochlorococcus marinus CUG1430]